MQKRFSVWMPLMMALILILGIQIGRMLSNSNGKPGMFSNGASSTFDEVLNFIQAKYVDTVNTAKLTDKAIEQLMVQLDPHSSFIPASDLKGVNELLDGNFDGIGVEFFTVNDTVTVVGIISGGPSEKAGLQVGDKIIMVNDSTIAGLGIADNMVMKKLRGKKGTTVNVGILRKGNSKLLSYKITRDKIPLNSIDASYMITSSTGYIKINRFSSTTYDEFIKSLTSLKSKGMQSLIIDLRGNGGGYLESATDIIDELLDQQKLMVYTKGRVYPKQEYNSRVLGHFENGPVAILIDEGSASASEIVAGAIQDWDRGVIVGRRSFGKGFVEDQLPLSDGSALRLTIAKYYTPSGRCIQKPYGQNVHDYYDEVYNRYTDGELTGDSHYKLSDSTKYFTNKGRTVYGGGGIIPDVFIPLDTSITNQPYIKAILDQNLLAPFAYSFYGNNKNQLTTIKSYSDLLLDKTLRSQLLSAFNKSTDELVNLRGSKSTIAGNYIMLQLQAYLARQMFGEFAFYAVLNTQDKTVQAALNALK